MPPADIHKARMEVVRAQRDHDRARDWYAGGFALLAILATLLITVAVLGTPARPSADDAGIVGVENRSYWALSECNNGSQPQAVRQIFCDLYLTSAADAKDAAHETFGEQMWRWSGVYAALIIASLMIIQHLRRTSREQLKSEVALDEAQASLISAELQAASPHGRSAGQHPHLGRRRGHRRRIAGERAVRRPGAS